MVNAQEIIHRLSEALGTKTDADMAIQLGVSKSTISNWKARNTVPYEQCMEVTKREFLSLNWLLTGEGPMYRDGSGEEAEAEPVEGMLEWLQDWWDKADEKQRIWLEIQLKRCFPEYAEWLEQKKRRT